MLARFVFVSSSVRVIFLVYSFFRFLFRSNNFLSVLLRVGFRFGLVSLWLVSFFLSQVRFVSIFYNSFFFVFFPFCFGSVFVRSAPFWPDQVVFSDQTEILLSKEARVVTFVSKNGKRETSSLERVLQEQR